MTEINPTEGNSQTPSDTLPNVTFESDANKPLGTGLEALQKQVEVLTKELRGIQGDKDRAAKRTEQKVDDLNKQIERILELNSSGKSENEIRRELLLDKILETGALPREVEGTTVDGAGLESQFNAIEELKKLGLDTNDADVAKLVSGRFRNPDHFRAEAATMALRKSKPNLPSDTLSNPPAGAPVVKAGQAELMASYKKEIAGYRGNIQVISDIQAKYRKLGLPV